MTNNIEYSFEKLFYTNLTEDEIKLELNINYKEYKRLLDLTKEKYGLPKSYRRCPHKYYKYDKNSYYLLKIKNDDFSIMGYYPIKSIAEEEYGKLSSDDGYVYVVEKASDENMRKLIYFGYINLSWNWEKIIQRTQLPYHKFYALLNQIKKEHNITINNKDRFIYHTSEGYYVVRRYVKGRNNYYGKFKDYKLAVHIRDYLESIGWDKEVWLKNKEDVLYDYYNILK